MSVEDWIGRHIQGSFGHDEHCSAIASSGRCDCWRGGAARVAGYAVVHAIRTMTPEQVAELVVGHVEARERIVNGLRRNGAVAVSPWVEGA